jgi:hypothetical protein
MNLTDNACQDKVAELETEIKILRAGFKFQVDALETLQKMLNSQNDENPWLGIVAALDLEQNKKDELEKQLEQMKSNVRTCIQNCAILMEAVAEEK